MASTVAMRLCVGNLAVPLETCTLEVVPEGGETETFEVVELDLSSRGGDFEWLERALGLPLRTFRRLDWPLLEEAREFLQARRAALPKRSGNPPNLGVWVDWRGRKVLFRNNLKSLRVCFQKGGQVEGLEWLLEELEKDCSSSTDGRRRPKFQRQPPVKGASAASGSAVGAQAPGAGVVDALEAEAREEILGQLRAHPRVAGASFCKSREALLVRAAFGGEGTEVAKRFFGVPALKRKRRTMEQEDREPEVIRGTFGAVYGSAARSALEALGPLEAEGGSPAKPASDVSDAASGGSASPHAGGGVGGPSPKDEDEDVCA